MDTDKGILYVATGERYVEEAILSSESFRRNMPDIPQAIFLDTRKHFGHGEDQLFDLVEELSNAEYSFLDKMRPLKDSPFKKTLFIDTDCYSVNPCYEIFDLLETYELAAVRAVFRGMHESEVCPECFPQFNTGVIAYRNNQIVHGFFAEWIRRYEEMYRNAEGYCSDQPPFQDTVYGSAVRLAVLPNEYNLHVGWPNLVAGMAKVKILHGRGVMLRRAIDELEAHPTAFLPRMVWFSNHEELEQIFGKQIYE